MNPVPELLARLLAPRYILLHEIGAGGMAVVYAAEDTRHRRTVAVKFLTSELGATLGAERFLREIEVAANLSHPHIVPVFDSGDADGSLYYVMPLIQGESVRARLARDGKMPIPEAVRVLRDVVDALAFAHRKGVIHRDIKPDNVLLTSGHALVADFGIAKAVSDATTKPTLTAVGLSIGTPAYMSPEQATGAADVDHRSDIHAIGALAYEMLVGYPPFGNGAPQAVFAALLTAPAPSIRQVRDSVPEVLDNLVQRCLAKDAAERWQSAGMLRDELDRIAALVSGMTPAFAPRASRRRQLTIAGGLATAVLGIAGYVYATRAPRFELSDIRQVTRDPGIEFEPAIAPDGKSVAYAAGDAGDIHLFVADLSGGRPLALTPSVVGEQRFPTWREDGSAVRFRLSANVFASAPRVGWKEVPRFGGQITTLIGSDSSAPDSLRQLTVPRGLPALSHSVARAPNDKWVAYVTGNWFYRQSGNLANLAESELYVRATDGGRPVLVAGGGFLNTAPAWMPDSKHLLFVSDRGGRRDLYWVKIADDGTPSGPPERLSTGLSPHTVSVDSRGEQIAFSQLTSKSNIWSIRVPDRGIVSILDARPVTAGNQTIEAHDISYADDAIVFDSDVNGASDIFIRPTGESEARRLTTDPGFDFAPRFSPDGSEIVFHSTRFGSRDLFLIRRDGSGETRLTATDSLQEQNARFSPNGRHIAFRVAERGTQVITRERPGLPWSAPRTISRRSNNSTWTRDSKFVVGHRTDSLELAAVDGSTTMAIPASRLGLRLISRIVASRVRDEIYIHGTSMAGAQGIFVWPIGGEKARLAIRLDEPRFRLAFSMATHGDRLHLSLVEQESDVYTAELRRR